MKMIRIVEDRQEGIWYFDKKEQKLIKISFEESQRINGVENIPAVGVIAGVIGMVVGISVYLSSRVSYVNERIQFLLICISALIGYLYQKHHEGVITAEVKKTGRMYDLTPEVLTCLSRANVKIHIMYVGFLAVMMADRKSVV